jgi:hypothetical protein
MAGKWITTLLARSVLLSGDIRKASFAKLRGYLWGFKWMISKKPNNGYNPYIKT